MESWLAEKKVKEGGIVGLDDEKEDFLCGYTEDLWPHYGVLRVCPYLRFDEIGVPWCGRGNGNSDEEKNLVKIELGCKGTVAEGQDHSRRDCIFEMDQGIVKPHIGAHL